MNRSFSLLLALATCVVVAIAALAQSPVIDDDLEKIMAALPQSAPAKPAKPRKVLVFSKTNGFRHGSIPVGIVSLTQLGEKTGAFEVTASEDEGSFDKQILAEFDAVIMLNTTGEVFRPKEWPEDATEREKAENREAELKQNLLDFVRQGKGLAGIHSATDTYKQWPEYNEMMGGAFASHPWHEKVPLKNLDPDSPVNAAFDKSGFEVTDEIYEFRNDTASPDARRMLLALDSAKMDVSKGNRDDDFYPVSWVDTYGEGRVFYSSLGHRDEIYWNETVLKHYLAGIQFALGDLEAETAPLPVDDK